MCGICGFISKNKCSSDVILEMNKAIKHRGKDDEGYVFGEINNFDSYSGEDSQDAIKARYKFLNQHQKGNFALGFRRLSIIDLSEKGHQPMISEKGNVITYNGEVYNFKEIREELKAAGLISHDFGIEYANLNFQDFAEDILRIYSERYNIDNLMR